MSNHFESFGKYVLLEKLATGGMAEVFLARGTGTAGIGKFFAIKRILPQYADSPEFIEMFKDEAKIAINLNHSNIVSIHEFGVEKGQFYLVMDYVEGRNLRQILNKMKKTNVLFSIDQIVYVIKEVAAGLDHAHRCIDGGTGKPLNITHRDMSPQNIMVSFEGEVKIVDFGIAKAESQIETTRAGTLKGKFGYMSPEQAEGLPVDLRTDIFSLGICVWELLANDRLFVANNEINTLRKIRDCQIPSLRKINPNIHTELERIVQKALARDRNLRYQTGAALHRDLNRFLNRQYPDFSAHDFSGYVKNVFADEILSLRKRLVEYAKVNLTVSLNIPSERSFSDTTTSSMLNTTTNSLVLASSGAELNAAVTGRDSATGKDTTGSVTHDNTASIDKSTQTEGTTNSLITASPLNTPLEISAGTRTDSNVLPPPTRHRSQSGVLDESALAAEATREIPKGKSPVPGNLETEELTSPSINRTRTMNRPGRTGVHHRQRSSGPKPARLLTYAVFGLMFFGFYAYLVKYFNPYMKEVIAVTDPYIHPLHVWLAVDKQTELASKPPPTQQPVVQAPASAPTPAPVPAQSPEVANSVMVISNPSGAEIFINNKSTGAVTPQRVRVPEGHFTVSIRKHGYTDFQIADTTVDKLSHRLTANLVKMNVAYVDIDVFPPPPDGVVLFMNGKKMAPQSLPIRQMPIPANTPLKIRAENKGGTYYDETTVNLQVDRRQSVQLNPRRSMRVPTNSNSE